VPTLARFQPNRNWAGPQRASEKPTENGNEAALGGIQNQKSKLKIGVLRSKMKRPREETNSDFSIKIQHDSYTAEVSALPPSLIETKFGSLLI
jgi:hypothetical protein